jgi:hypothetical protein
MEQSVLNNNIHNGCQKRQPDIFLNFESYYLNITATLQYSGFDATTSNHIWQQVDVAGNTWTNIQTGGVTLNNANLVVGTEPYLLRVEYTDNCGYKHYTKVVLFYTSL